VTFPTPFVVEHEVAAVVVEDDLGNNSVIFAAPVEQKVIAIAPATVENLEGHASRAITDVDLYVPQGFAPGLQDRITLPDGRLFEVIGFDDHNYGFHQWAPGNVVKLKLVSG
jgi:hypothetical protein